MMVQSLSDFMDFYKEQAIRGRYMNLAPLPPLPTPHFLSVVR